MKNILCTVTLLSALGTNVAFATPSNRPVFYDTASGQFYYRDGDNKVFVDVEGQPGMDGVDGSNGSDGVDGLNGKDGVDGLNGKDGVNGQSFDYNRAQNDMSAVAGLGGIDLRQGSKGITSWSAGVGMVGSEGDTKAAMAFGLHYGIEDNLGVYGKVSKSFEGDSFAAFVGIEGQF